MNPKLLAAIVLVAMFALAMALLGRAATSAPVDVVGVASVIDADTLDIHGQRIRLHGIDAPESAQVCLDKAGGQWRCGQQASLALADHIGRSTVRCERRDTDRYGRMVARCFKADEDLNGWLVRQGWAVAYRQYSTDYVAAEDAAKTAGAGVWAGTFVMPWDWRRGQRIVPTAAPRAAAGGCAIKGNISSRGERIYHVPGGRWYGPTKINEAAGERWFCSEDEARAAGWRRSGQ